MFIFMIIYFCLCLVLSIFHKGIFFSLKEWCLVYALVNESRWHKLPRNDTFYRYCMGYLTDNTP